MYPSIRKLPLLGVTYADLYRRTKIQEAVLEALTKEYEMAKVQEAKEIPTVKVLDKANIPDKKSFPPRPLFVFLGTALGLALAVTSILWKTAWDETDANDERKMFAQEVFGVLRTRLPVFAQNGSGNGNGSRRFWSVRRGHEEQAESEHKTDK